jgi:hypothetical protein
LGISSILAKNKEDSIRIDAGRREQHTYNSPDRILETEVKFVDPLLKRVEDDNRLLDNSRRIQLENGFNELEDEI